MRVMIITILTIVGIISYFMPFMVNWSSPFSSCWVQAVGWFGISPKYNPYSDSYHSCHHQYHDLHKDHHRQHHHQHHHYPVESRQWYDLASLPAKHKLTLRLRRGDNWQIVDRYLDFFNDVLRIDSCTYLGKKAGCRLWREARTGNQVQMFHTDSKAFHQMSSLSSLTPSAVSSWSSGSTTLLSLIVGVRPLFLMWGRWRYFFIIMFPMLKSLDAGLWRSWPHFLSNMIG